MRRMLDWLEKDGLTSRCMFRLFKLTREVFLAGSGKYDAVIFHWTAAVVAHAGRDRSRDHAEQHKHHQCDRRDDRERLQRAAERYRALRVGPATARARSCPARMKGYAVNRLGNMICDRPPTVSAIAGAAPS